MKKSTSAKKNKKKRSPAYAFLRITTLAIIIFALFRVFAQQPLLNQYDQKLNEYAQKIEEEKENIKHYKNLKDLYQTDEYKMIIAKERLGLVEENEKVYIDANGK